MTDYALCCWKSLCLGASLLVLPRVDENSALLAAADLEKQTDLAFDGGDWSKAPAHYRQRVGLGDAGYHSHNAPCGRGAQVFTFGWKCGVAAQIKRQLRRQCPADAALFARRLAQLNQIQP